MSEETVDLTVMERTFISPVKCSPQGKEVIADYSRQEESYSEGRKYIALLNIFI